MPYYVVSCKDAADVDEPNEMRIFAHNLHEAVLRYASEKLPEYVAKQRTKPNSNFLECECLLNVRDGRKSSVIKVSCKEISFRLEEIS